MGFALASLTGRAFKFGEALSGPSSFRVALLRPSDRPAAACSPPLAKAGNT